MVIVYLYDRLNGYRYRHFSYDYYQRNVAHCQAIVAAWMVPGIEQENH